MYSNTNFNSISFDKKNGATIIFFLFIFKRSEAKPLQKSYFCEKETQQIVLVET